MRAAVPCFYRSRPTGGRRERGIFLTRSGPKLRARVDLPTRRTPASQTIGASCRDSSIRLSQYGLSIMLSWLAFTAPRSNSSVHLLKNCNLPEVCQTPGGGASHHHVTYQMGEQTVRHIQTEFSTLDWILEEMFARSGFWIAEKDRPGIITVCVCKKQWAKIGKRP